MALQMNPGQITELYRFCEEDDEIFVHILNECPCFISARRDILNNVSIVNTNKWKAKTVLTFSHVDAIDEALSTDIYLSLIHI